MYGLRHLDSSVVSFMKYVLSTDLADECIQDLGAIRKSSRREDAALEKRLSERESVMGSFHSTREQAST
jgi:hypothetical protein